MMNGNIIDNIKIIQWNLGSKLWKNKLDDIELLLSEQKLDLCFIMEVNLWEGCGSHEKGIPGHWLNMPNTVGTLHHARIVLVVRDGIVSGKA